MNVVSEKARFLETEAEGVDNVLRKAINLASSLYEEKDATVPYQTHQDGLTFSETQNCSERRKWIHALSKTDQGLFR